MQKLDANFAEKADAAYVPFVGFSEWTRISLDSDRLDRILGPLKQLKSAEPERLRRAFEIVKRAAAIETGAIEGLYETDRGFTFTAATANAVVATLGDPDSTRARLIESQLSAYDYVLDFATAQVPIAEAWIRQLHEVICNNQDTYRVETAVGPQEQTLPKGQYKTVPNHVKLPDGSVHSYAPVNETQPEMARLCQEFSRSDFMSAQPVLQAAFAHYAFVWVHPFSDGNGRVARALASVFTFRAFSLPILILGEHKPEYLSALRSADRGDRESFARFILSRTVDAALVVEDSLRAAALPDIDTLAASLQRVYLTKGGFTHAAVDEAAGRLLDLLMKRLTERLNELLTPVTGRVQTSFTSASLASGQGYRPPVNGAQAIQINLALPAPADVSREWALWLRVPIDGGATEEVLFMNGEAQKEFGVPLGELMPAISAVAELRLNMFIEALVRRFVDEVRQAGSARVRERGY